MQIVLTQGKISKSIILFSLPMILGNILQQLYNIVDMLIVGKTIGATALSAVGSSYALMVLLTSVILGLCMGSSVVFSQLYGAKNTDDMKVSIFNAFLFIFGTSITLNIISYAILDKFIAWLNVPLEAVDFTYDYLKIVLSGMFFVTVYNFISSILRSVGNTFIPLVFLGVSAVTNIILDILFIVILHLGVKGAAIATVLAQILSAISITVYFLYKSKDIHPNKAHIHYDKDILSLVISNSVLTALQQSIMNIGILVVHGLVNSYGFACSAAFAVVNKIDAFAYMPAQDFGNAFATFVAQNNGAKKQDRINQGIISAIKVSSLFCITASILVYVFAKELMLVFINSNEVEALKIGIHYLHIVGPCYIGIGILSLMYATFRGLAKSNISIVLTVTSLGSRIILAYWLSPIIGLTGIWLAIPIGWALADTLGLCIYFKHYSKHYLYT